MDTNKMREQFEVAAKSQGLSLARTQQALRFANGTSRAAGDYVALETLCAWWAWQAALEGFIEILRRNHPLLSDDGLSEMDHHCEWAVQQERKRLHAAINSAEGNSVAETCPSTSPGGHGQGGES